MHEEKKKKKKKEENWEVIRKQTEELKTNRISAGVEKKIITSFTLLSKSFSLFERMVEALPNDLASGHCLYDTGAKCNTPENLLPPFYS